MTYLPTVGTKCCHGPADVFSKEMGSEPDHYNQALRNERCFMALSALNPNRFTEWEVITLFYSALQYGEALLDRFSTNIPHPKSHAERQTDLSHQFDDELMTSYLYLHDQSEDARYRLKFFSDEDVAQLHQEEFTPIRDKIKSLLGI